MQFLFTMQIKQVKFLFPHFRSMSYFTQLERLDIGSNEFIELVCEIILKVIDSKILEECLF